MIFSRLRRVAGCFPCVRDCIPTPPLFIEEVAAKRTEEFNLKSKIIKSKIKKLPPPLRGIELGNRSRTGSRSTDNEQALCLFSLTRQFPSINRGRAGIQSLTLEKQLVTCRLRQMQPATCNSPKAKTEVWYFSTKCGRGFLIFHVCPFGYVVEVKSIVAFCCFRYIL